MDASTGRESARLAGRYTLLDALGAGGMGTVHRARDEATGRIVAFKQLISSMCGNRRRSAEALFEREYRTLARLKHPRIIEVYDYGVVEAGPYYTMELLDGGDLHKRGVMPFRDACNALRDVASSLALIHANRLVHRDVSPRNVRLTLEGRAKLIDFGALASFGVAEDIVGTPHCMAPEALHRMPLDPRTDLYALGVVAYFALTGRAPYPARNLDELPAVWEIAPVRPSTFARDVPPELDALVLSLLNLDPLARPATAAAVIDRLTAIAGLPPEGDQTAKSYLASSGMVGRATEMDWVERRVVRAQRGSGAEVVVEGAPGVGKTRLLHEAGLRAQLRGAVVLKADANANSSAGPFGVAIALSLALLDACPEAARAAAGADVGLLCHLSSRLAEKLGDAPAVSVPTDPGERRARLHTALHDWFVSVARERVLFVGVDNIQAADDNSASFLAALGREARNTRLVLFATQRTGAEVVASTPVRSLRKRASHLKLKGLGADSCEELIKSVFGDVPNTGRVARLLFEKSAGVPRELTDLIELLVEKKIAQYGSGTWVLPQDVAPEELPNRGAELLANRLSTLGEHAVDLADALCVHARPVPLERCLALAEGKSEEAAYGALDELVAEQILRTDGDTYEFVHAALREGLLARMDAGARRARLVRAADALLASNRDDPNVQIEAALQFIDGGEETRGANIIAALALKLLATTYFNAGAETVVALAKAVEIFEKEGRSDYELLTLLIPMMKLAYYSPHFRLLLKYGERTLSIGLRLTGLSLAARLRPIVGRKLALVVGLLVGGAGFSKQRRRGLAYDLKTAISLVCSIVPAITATHATCLDAEGVERIKDVLEPLTLFGSKHVASLIYAWAPQQLLTVQGREGEALDLIEENRARNAEPWVRAALGEQSYKSFCGGLLFPKSLMSAYVFGDEALRGAAELEKLGIRTWAMAADQIRMLYHAFRGESEHVQRYRERVELFAVQGSTTWQAELFWPALLINADVLTGDTIGARRTSEQLARRAEAVKNLKRFADAAHAAYLMLRGDTRASIALFEQILSQFPLRRSVAYETARAYLAQALNAAGEHARARDVVREVLDHMAPQDHRVVVHFLEPERQLALAEAGLGNHAEAVRILDALLAKHGGEDNPLLVGLLHKARTEVALAMSDLENVERHLRETEARFRSTKNPALIAQWERLAEQVSRAGIRGPAQRLGSAEDGAFASETVAARTVGELSAFAEPCDAALRLILREASASVGFLYVYGGDAMRLVAARAPGDAPRELEVALEQLAATGVASLQEPALRTDSESMDEGEEDDPEAFDTVFVPSAPPPNPWGPYQLVLLREPRPGSAIVSGGLIVEASAAQMARVGPQLIGAIARLLDERGTQTSALTGLGGTRSGVRGTEAGEGERVSRG
ncbi:MAG TPA: protein kinase [Polyangiaceae bacterium]|nr:protein kinase [Polyangiaceae bacterium]